MVLRKKGRVMTIFGGRDKDSKRLTKKIAEGGIQSVRVKLREDKSQKKKIQRQEEKTESHKD
jgi:hypothetical protein